MRTSKVHTLQVTQVHNDCYKLHKFTTSVTLQLYIYSYVVLRVSDPLPQCQIMISEKEFSTSS